ncbi:MAG: DUF2807 domain-containing protein [Bacteroidetes bacterium]|nr:DUF2807 domain-containing protein [Bacteroidota bacterium]
MHKITSLLLILAFASSCMMGVVGNGKVQEQNREVESFNSIHASGMFEIHIQQGESARIKLVADENLHELITTEVRNGTLMISSSENISKAKELDLYITIPELNELDLSGAVSVDTKGELWSENIDISSSGAAEINMNISASKIRLSLSGASEVDLKGQCDDVSVDASGASEINMYDLECRRMRLDLSGASEVSAFVSEELKISASGASDIRYRGNPKIQQSLSGAASLKKAE